MPAKKSITCVTVVLLGVYAVAAPRQQDRPEDVTKRGPTETQIMWQDPGDISARDLFYGIGGEQRQPRGRFTFVEEDLGGTTPKFVVRDENGEEWKVKLGREASAETAATRLIWAVGFFTDEDYIVPVLRVDGMRPLQRGRKYVSPDGSMRNARLERRLKGAKLAGGWRWRDNPFEGTRDLNGLRTLMALINNWDLKDSNNAVFAVDGPQGPRHVYLVSDVGAAFGTSSYRIPSGKSNLKAYMRSKFVTKVSGDLVSFQAPARPPLASLYVVPHLLQTIHRSEIRPIGRDIPREHARWVGQQLSHLSPRQIRAAFESGGYSSYEVEGFSRVVESRITQLMEL